MALDDLDSARIMLRERKFNNVCYFSQQAAEKVLKGYLQDKGVNPPKIHNLIELVRLSKPYNSDFSSLDSHARVLDQFYIPTRYPISPIGSTPEGMPSEQLAKKAICYAEDIIAFVNCNGDKV